MAIFHNRPLKLQGQEGPKEASECQTVVGLKQKNRPARSTLGHVVVASNYQY